MSRGLGRVQLQVLSYLEKNPTAATLETLRWDLWCESEGGGAAALQDGKLPNKWNTSVGRAVDSLSDGKYIQTHERRLSSFDECVVHYPSKTLRDDVRRLRLDLLPILQRWTTERGNFARYTPADNERFHLEALPRPKFEELQERWRKVEPKLMTLLPALSGEAQNGVFQLIAKGKSLFLTQELKARRSFAELANACVEWKVLPEKVAKAVHRMCDALLAPGDAGFLRLKSYIHAFAHVPRHRKCWLKDDAVEYLDKHARAVVRGLPGYVPAKEPPDTGRVRMIHLMSEPKQSELLNHLIDQTVFQKFHFLEVMPASERTKPGKTLEHVG